MQARYELGPFHMGRLPKGSDLLSGLLEVVKEKGITSGILWAIGGLESVRFAYYDQALKSYKEISIEKGLEILSLVGNISQKGDLPFIHAHIIVSDEEHTWGGHLMEGSKVFALEYHILELRGPTLVRGFDPETGLFLWEKAK
ncbi:MAG: PPC domain-containing DNA-binding protein [Desulfatiglandales bacterium]